MESRYTLHFKRLAVGGLLCALLATAACSPDAARVDGAQSERALCGDAREPLSIDANLISEVRALTLRGGPARAPCDEVGPKAASKPLRFERVHMPVAALPALRRVKEVKEEPPAEVRPPEPPADALPSAAEPSASVEGKVAEVAEAPAAAALPPFKESHASPPIDGDTSPPFNGDIIE